MVSVTTGCLFLHLSLSLSVTHPYAHPDVFFEMTLAAVYRQADLDVANVVMAMGNIHNIRGEYMEGDTWPK